MGAMGDWTWDYTNPYEYMEKVRTGMPPLIISVAITGGVHGKEYNPNLPETPDEQAQQTEEVYKAGASVVHVHARNPENLSLVSADPDVYREINKKIRERCPDIIINNTTGGGAGLSSEERMASLYAGPELASLNCGPFVLQLTLKERKEPLTHPRPEIPVDMCIPVTFGETERYATVMKENGIKPELEVYHSGQFWLVQNLIMKGLIEPPYIIQFVMGFQAGAFPVPQNLLNLMEHLPPDSIFEVIGVAWHQVHMTTLAILWGGHVRVGLEDNVYARRGELAKSNTQFVERTVKIAEALGRPVATPAQAREMLGISPTPSQY